MSLSHDFDVEMFKLETVDRIMRHPLNDFTNEFLSSRTSAELKNIYYGLDTDLRFHLIEIIRLRCEVLGLIVPANVSEYHLTTLTLMKKELDSLFSARGKARKLNPKSSV